MRARSWLVTAICIGGLLVGCGPGRSGGKSYEEVLQMLRSGAPDDAAKAFRDAELSQEERFAIDALCTTADSYNDQGQPPGSYDWVGVYRRSTAPPAGFSVGTIRRSADRLDTALNLGGVSPVAGARYVQFCLNR